MDVEEETERGTRPKEEMVGNSLIRAPHLSVST